MQADGSYEKKLLCETERPLEKKATEDPLGNLTSLMGSIYHASSNYRFKGYNNESETEQNRGAW